MGIFSRGSKPVARDEYGRIPLHYAAVNKDAAKVHTLLASGEDPNDRDLDGHTPLHLAAQKNSTEVLTLLLDAGADVNAVSNNNQTPLLIAVAAPWSSADTVRLLLARGADPHYVGQGGYDAIKYVSGLSGPQWKVDLLPILSGEPTL